MNTRLRELLKWANDESVDLDNAQIDCTNYEILFYQHREKRDNFRSLKRALDGFDKKGDPPYVSLEKRVAVGYYFDGEEIIDRWKIKWQGAYKCNISYDCVAENFEDDDKDIEDFQLEKAGLTP